MGNFCTNCGTKLGEDYNFCTNCGAKINKTDIKPTIQLLKSMQDNMEKEKTRIAKEKEEERKKARSVKKMSSEKIKENKMTHGGHCSLGCRHCYEEFLDSGGGIVGDFDSGGYTEYYCRLGHSVSLGSFCEDYE